MRKKLLMSMLIGILSIPMMVSARTEVHDGKTCTMHDNYYLFYADVTSKSEDNDSNDTYYTAPDFTATTLFFNDIPSTAIVTYEAQVSVPSNFINIVIDCLTAYESNGDLSVTGEDGNEYFCHLQDTDSGNPGLEIPRFWRKKSDNSNNGYGDYYFLNEGMSTSIQNDLIQRLNNSLYTGLGVKTSITKIGDASNLNSTSKLLPIQISRTDINIPTSFINSCVDMRDYWIAGGDNYMATTDYHENYCLLPAVYRYSYYDPATDCTSTSTGTDTDDKKQSYTITYSANGGKNEPSQHIKNEGIATNISTQKPTRDGYTFLGWSESSSAREANSKYAPGAAYTEDRNIVLYAVWTPKSGLGYSIGIISAIVVLTGVGIWYFSKRNKFENV